MHTSRLNQPYWTPVAVATVLLLLTFWLGRLQQVDGVQDASGFEHVPDYIVENFNAVAFDAVGRPRYHLRAEKMTHFMDDDSTTLDRPEFSREQPGRPVLHGQAARGLVSSDGENIYLIDDVRFRQGPGASQAPFELTTKYLRIVPDADLIRTDKPVTLRQERSVVTAMGMVADGKQRTLLLKGRVNGIYDNPR